MGLSTDLPSFRALTCDGKGRVWQRQGRQHRLRELLKPAHTATLRRATPAVGVGGRASCVAACGGGAHLGVHEVKVLCLGGQGRDVLLLATVAVQAVVVIQADDGGHVADQRVAVGVAAWEGVSVRTCKRTCEQRQATGALMRACWAAGAIPPSRIPRRNQQGCCACNVVCASAQSRASSSQTASVWNQVLKLERCLLWPANSHTVWCRTCTAGKARQGARRPCDICRYLYIYALATEWLCRTAPESPLRWCCSQVRLQQRECTSNDPQCHAAPRVEARSPAGGLGTPPKMPVMRRMNVDLPQPARHTCGSTARQAACALSDTYVYPSIQGCQIHNAPRLTRVSSQANDHDLVLVSLHDQGAAAQGAGALREERASEEGPTPAGEHGERIGAQHQAQKTLFTRAATGRRFEQTAPLGNAASFEARPVLESRGVQAGEGSLIGPQQHRWSQVCSLLTLKAVARGAPALHCNKRMEAGSGASAAACASAGPLWAN